MIKRDNFTILSHKIDNIVFTFNIFSELFMGKIMMYSDFFNVRVAIVKFIAHMRLNPKPISAKDIPITSISFASSCKKEDALKDWRVMRLLFFNIQ